MEDLSVPNLISLLRSSFQKSVFERVEKILVERESSAKGAISEANAAKEVQTIKLETKCESLRKEAEEMRSRCAQLEEMVKKAGHPSGILAAEQENKQSKPWGVTAMPEAEVAGMLLDDAAEDGKAGKHGVLAEHFLRKIEMMKKRENEIMNRNEELKADVGEWKKKYGELEAWILRLVGENLSREANGAGVAEEICGKDGENPVVGRNGDGGRTCEETKNAIKIELPAAGCNVIEIVDSDDEMEDCSF